MSVTAGAVGVVDPPADQSPGHVVLQRHGGGRIVAQLEPQVALPAQIAQRPELRASGLGQTVAQLGRNLQPLRPGRGSSRRPAWRSTQPSTSTRRKPSPENMPCRWRARRRRRRRLPCTAWPLSRRERGVCCGGNEREIHLPQRQRAGRRLQRIENLDRRRLRPSLPADDRLSWAAATAWRCSKRRRAGA